MGKTRAIALLTGRAAEIWKKIPKGMRSFVLEYLIEDAYRLGKLDPFLKREESLFLEDSKKEEKMNLSMEPEKEEEWAEEKDSGTGLKPGVSLKGEEKKSEEEEDEDEEELDFIKELEEKFSIQ